MAVIKAKNIKVGEQYFFPDTHFDYSRLFKVSISVERINKVFSDGDYTTKNLGDTYEKERVIGFKTKEEAQRYLVKRIKERLKDIEKEATEEIKKLLLE